MNKTLRIEALHEVAIQAKSYFHESVELFEAGVSEPSQRQIKTLLKQKFGKLITLISESMDYSDLLNIFYTFIEGASVNHHHPEPVSALHSPGPEKISLGV